MGYLVTVGTPNEVEVELGRQYAKLAMLAILDGAKPEDEHPDLAATLAAAFATHRARNTELVGSILYGLELECLTDEALDAFSRGWTPDQVRRLVAAYRSLRHHVDAASELIPQVLSGARAR